MRRHVDLNLFFTISFMLLFTVSGTQVAKTHPPYRVGTGQRIMFDVVPSCVREGVNVLQPVHLRACPCFVSFGLSTNAPSQVEVDFLVIAEKTFNEWHPSRYNEMPEYLPEFSAIGKRANEYNMVYDNFFFQTPNIELRRNESFVLAIRTTSDNDDCDLEIMHIFQSMPRPCPARLRSEENKRTHTTRKPHVSRITMSYGKRSGEMRENGNLEEVDRLRSREMQTRTATLQYRFAETHNFAKNAVNLREAKLRTSEKKEAYSKTDQYTSINNVVAGSEVNDLTIRLYMVSIRSSSGACSGTVIGSKWILTAAHCQVREGGEALVGGDTNLNGASYRVNRFIAHPDYRLSQQGQVEANDIALIETDPMKHGNAVLLNMNGKGPDSGRFVRASGYGQIAEEWTSSAERMLLQVDIPVVSFERCIQAFVSYGAPEFARALQSGSHMCAGYADDDCAGDTCYGDSGGPIVARAGGKYVQVGVVSGGIGCARKGLPGFYTRVGRYWEWIANVTNGDVGGFSVPGDDGADEVNVSAMVDEDESSSGAVALRTLGIIASAIGLGVILLVMAVVVIKRIGRMVVEPTAEGKTNETQQQSASLDQLLRFERVPKNGEDIVAGMNSGSENGADVDGEMEQDESEYQRPTYSRTKTR